MSLVFEPINGRVDYRMSKVFEPKRRVDYRISAGLYDIVKDEIKRSVFIGERKMSEVVSSN